MARTFVRPAPLPAWGWRAATRLSGHVLARTGWVVVAVVVLSVYVSAVPATFAQLRAVCADGRRCGLTPAQAHTLLVMGIPPDAYALYIVGLGLILAALYGAVAALLAWRQAGDRVALLSAYALLAFGTVTYTPFISTFVTAYPAWRPLMAALAFLGGTALTLVLYLFPDGRFVPRWTCGLSVPFILGQAGHYALPGTVPADYATWPFPLTWLLFASGLGPALGSQVYRYRRVSGPVQRQQTKWVVSGLIGAFGIFLGAALAFDLLVPQAVQQHPLASVAVDTLVVFALLLIPLTIGAAIGRYRLWDIDLLLNRSLVCGGLTLGIAGLYVLTVGLLGILFQTHGNMLVAITATGLVAVLFQPLRARLQRWANRLVYGERDDPYAVLTQLGRRLEGTLAPADILPTIVQTAAAALKLPYAALTLQGDKMPVARAAIGTPVTALLRLPVIYQGETLGELALGPRAPGEAFSAADRHLLGDLARQAGAAAHALRLHAEATRLATDLQQAREHLVVAREEERRRLRRDLHDGLGSQLGSQTFTLSAARTLLRSDPDAADALLADATVHSRDAVVALRQLAHGLRPPALDDLGLFAALQEQAHRYAPAGIDMTIAAPSSLPPLPAAVEVAAYRIAQEALTNVVRHARASQCTIHLAASDALYLEVRDDGCGLPAERRAGVGLASMRERAAELGGECTIEAFPGHGTRVCVRLPLSAEVD